MQTGRKLRCANTELVATREQLNKRLSGTVVQQNFSDLEQDLEETTAQESRQGRDMQVAIPR